MFNQISKLSKKKLSHYKDQQDRVRVEKQDGREQ